MIIPSAVGRYQSDTPGSVLNQIESHVPMFATKNGSTHVHQGKDGDLVSLSLASAGFETVELIAIAFYF
jgi:hypothetical protein